MKVNLKEITGNWPQGYALVALALGSTHIGYKSSGYVMLYTTRTYMMLDTLAEPSTVPEARN